MKLKMPDKWRPLLWILLSAVGLGAIPGLLRYLYAGADPHRVLIFILYGSLYSACIGTPCWLVLPRVLCALDARPLLWRAGASLGLLGVFTVAGCVAADLLLLAFGVLRPATLRSELTSSLRISFLITFTFGLLTLVIVTLQSRLASVQREVHRRQMAEERERKIAAQARFASLESRVHPHFLFNTLNSIAALVREDPAEAERMIGRLATLLRYSLDSEHAGVVALGEELRVVKEYLEIEKVRFGARLRYRIDADEAAARQTVPALSIQTLVENSVKYAVGSRREGAEIVVAARITPDGLRVEVLDDGPGFEPAEPRKPGHGLDLLERRLASLFGPSASLEIGAAEGWTRVVISLAS